MYVVVDIETYSGASLPACGVYKYAEDPDFQVLLIAYAINGAEPVVFEPAEDPTELACFLELYRNPEVRFWAFNAQFERVCLARAFGARVWHCVQARAIYNGLPNSLENCCQVLGVRAKTDQGRLVTLFCTPQKPSRQNGFRSRITKAEAPTEWLAFRDYVLQDVRCAQKIIEGTETIPESEELVYTADQEINDRGVPVDYEFVEGAMAVDAVTDNGLREYLAEATGLENPNSKTQMKAFCQARLGVPVPVLDKTKTKEIIETTEDRELALILKRQTQLAMSSTTKYKTITEALCKDGRVRGLLKYYGANTGRWAGRLVQLQNLPSEGLDDMENARALVKEKQEPLLRLLYGDVKKVLSELIRSAFIAPEGHSLIVADFSAIEARVIAWLAGETWRQQVFASHGKIYEASASQMFKVPIEEVSKEMRKKGKIAELALGYGGGLGALRAFGAEKLGLSEQDLRQLVTDWRSASPAIPALWDSLEKKAKAVIETGGMANVRGIRLFMKGRHLILKLPSGRCLYYRDVRIEDGQIAYNCRQSLAKFGYGSARTYGGKLTENVVQAIARDLLADALLKLRERGVPVLFHVHDEIIAHVPKEKSDEALAEMIQIMCEVPSWASGLYLKAAGFVSEYYKKD